MQPHIIPPSPTQGCAAQTPPCSPQGLALPCRAPRGAQGTQKPRGRPRARPHHPSLGTCRHPRLPLSLREGTGTPDPPPSLTCQLPGAFPNPVHGGSGAGVPRSPGCWGRLLPTPRRSPARRREVKPRCGPSGRPSVCSSSSSGPSIRIPAGIFLLLLQPWGCWFGGDVAGSTAGPPAAGLFAAGTCRGDALLQKGSGNRNSLCPSCKSHFPHGCTFSVQICNKDTFSGALSPLGPLKKEKEP